MKLTFGVYRNCIISLLLACAAWGQTPTIFIAGHSTSADANRAWGCRRSRTFITAGLWAKLPAEVRPHDYVLIQFGHNH